MEWFYIILWSAVLIFTVILEISTVSLTSIWFSAASLVSLILAACGVNIYIQSIVFVVLSAILIVATRPLVKRSMNKDLIRTNADKVIEMIGVVTKSIPVGEIGEVKVNSELWRAVSLETTEILVGEQVIINSFSGNKLLVSRTNKPNNMEII